MSEDRGDVALPDPLSPDEEAGPIGPFPSWRAVYLTVLVYWAALVAVLYVLTLILDAPGR